MKKGGYQRAPSYYSYSAPREPARQGGYAQALSRAAGMYGQSTAATKPKALDLSKGDMVYHTAFGRGMVLSVLKMGGDALWEIAFDQIGTKKLMANTASAHMKKL